MGLETGTYISDLVATNPTASDPVAQGDDHVRLIKSTVKATFPNVSGAVTPTHTELNYVDGVTSAIQTQLNTLTTSAERATLTSGTSTASTSGTSIDYTSIPSWAKRITIVFAGFSTSGTSIPMVQLGDSGGVETSGYLGSGANMDNGLSTTASNSTAGFLLSGSWLAATVYHGIATLVLLDAATNTWVYASTGGLSNAAALLGGGGRKALSATLDRVRITTVGGADTFDAGSVNILYD